MTGIAALALCVGFTSCSHNDEIEVYTQEQIDKAKYDQAFLNYVGGKIAADQDWGFSANITAASRMTRSINVNGNLWSDCPSVGSTEESDVLTYLSTLQSKEKNPVNLQNYYVTQIHKGTQDYWNVGGGYVGVGSDKMNNLHIAMTSSATINAGALSGEGSSAWEHINNFNAGNCEDWSAGSDNHGNTLVIAGGTHDFAYEGAEDSKYHNRWCSIDGANVQKTGGGNYAGHYYICFDFEQSASTITVFRIQFNVEKDNGNGGTQTDSKNEMFTLTGTYSTAAEIVAAMNSKFTWEEQEYTLTEDMINSINVESGNQQVNPNSDYKDWIIRLVKAEREDEQITETYDIRIMGEDLSAEEDGDFDFNDIVLDVKFSKADDTNTKVRLCAAGGTLPLYIITEKEQFEVHNLFGVGTGVMVNTAAGHHFDKDAVEFELKDVTIANAAEAKTKITLKVDKNGVLQPLTAEIHEPAAKIAITSTVPGDWLDERVSIKDVKTAFIDWANNNKSRSTWWNE